MAFFMRQQSSLTQFLSGDAIRDLPSKQNFRTVLSLPKAYGNEAYSNGAYGNGSSRDDNGTVEMYVASADDLDDLYNSPALHRSKSVPPPRNAAPRSFGAMDTTEESEALQRKEGGETKLLQVELGLTTSELRNTTRELDRSRSILREQKHEIQMLKAALSERDTRLRSSKAQNICLQASLKDKDVEMHAVFHQLMSDAQERGFLRQQLMDAQNEVADTRAELESWAQASISDREQKANSDGSSNRSSAQPSNLQVLALMTAISKLSQQIADDALADEVAYKEAA